MMTLCKRLWGRRWLRYACWALLIVPVVVFGFYIWVNLWGVGRLTAARSLVRAEGETLDLAELLPPAIPDGENFCAIPVLADLAWPDGLSEEAKQAAAKRERIQSLFKLPVGGNAGSAPSLALGVTRGVAPDLEAFAQWMRATGSFPMPSSGGKAASDILAGLSSQAPFVAELKAALGRPRAQWTPPLQAHDGPEPLLVRMKLAALPPALSLSRSLTLRAIAAARAGQAAEAIDANRIALRFREASAGEPLLIDQLLAQALDQMINQAIWEVCRAQIGKVDDWVLLERSVAKLDPRASCLGSFRGEMAAGLEFLDYAGRTGDPKLIYPVIWDSVFPPPLSAPEMAMLGAAVRIIPRGLIEANEAALLSAEYEAFVRPLRDDGWGGMPTKAKALVARMEEIRRRPFRHLDSLAVNVPALAKSVPKLIWGQAVLDQALIACALERYRLEHGAYPDALDELKLADGRPLPLDPVTGRPMHYRQTDDGRYALWSEGLEGIDHGGMRGIPSVQPYEEIYSGDWVWSFRPDGKKSALPQR